MPIGVYIRKLEDIKKRAKTFKKNGKTKNEKHWNWKKENVGLSALHWWIRNHYKKNLVCSKCGKKGNTDWANKSGEYLRDISDYMELCRSCHMQYDGKAKLKPIDILNIRESYRNRNLSQGMLAKKYNVSKMNIYNIVHYYRWSHIK